MATSTTLILNTEARRKLAACYVFLLGLNERKKKPAGQDEIGNPASLAATPKPKARTRQEG